MDNECDKRLWPWISGAGGGPRYPWPQPLSHSLSIYLYRLLSMILDVDRILLCQILELLGETKSDWIIRCGRPDIGLSMLLRPISEENVTKPYLKIQNWGVGSGGSVATGASERKSILYLIARGMCDVWGILILFEEYFGG